MIRESSPYQDYKHVVRAARDPIQAPTELVIVELAAKNLCHLGLGEDCFTLTNVYGTVAEVPYGASIADWTIIAERLLKDAMEKENE